MKARARELKRRGLPGNGHKSRKRAKSNGEGHPHLSKNATARGTDVATAVLAKRVQRLTVARIVATGKAGEFETAVLMLVNALI